MAPWWAIPDGTPKPMSERVVHRFPAPNPFRTRLVAVDVTDPTIFASKPYRIVRDGIGPHPALLIELNRDELANLHDSLTRELLARELLSP